MNDPNENIPIEHIRAISDPQRLAILRRLMSGKATLSQLGDFFDATAAHVRHHLKVLEHAGLVELCEVRPVRGFLEKYYRATSYALQIHFTVIPEERRAVTIGTMDHALARLAERMAAGQPGLIPLVFPLSSLDGLVSLRQGICQIASCHLLDPETGEYNRSFIRRLFPGQPMVLVHLYEREEGLIVRAGNPLQLHGLEDLARKGVRMVNREHGSGVRVWFDQQIKQLGILPENLEGYERITRSHQAAALAVLDGLADAVVGIAAHANNMGLDFIPLCTEPYDLVISEEEYQNPRLVPFFDLLNSADFVRLLGDDDLISGYHVTNTRGSVELIS